jgi:uncharacterized protein (TIGR03085 family)
VACTLGAAYPYAPAMPGLPPLRAGYVRKERQALCETARAVGPQAPTLCEGWDTKDLICHLLVRESTLLGATGIAVSALSWATERDMARLKKQPFERLVERLRTHRLTIFVVPPVDAAFNTLEFFVHHEDIRRAQPGWRRRILPDDAIDTLWQSLRAGGPALARSVGVPLVVRRTDTDETTTLLPGSDPVELSGPVTELVFYLFGRNQVRGLAFDGPDDKVAKLKRADLGL